MSGFFVMAFNHLEHKIDSPLADDGDGGPKPKKGAKAGRNPAQDKKLSPGEIKKLKEAGWDHGDKGVNGKGGGAKDLHKDKDGNVYEKPKNGNGPGEPIGVNLNDLSVKVGIGAVIVGGTLKALDWVMSRAMPIFMVTPFMMETINPQPLYKRREL